MDLQVSKKLRGMRSLLLALAAFFVCLHAVVEPLHLSASHGTPSHECALCQAIDTGAPPQVVAALPTAPTLALAPPTTALLPQAPPSLPPTERIARGPPSFLS
jgi:hypothetical protein